MKERIKEILKEEVTHGEKMDRVKKYIKYVKGKTFTYSGDDYSFGGYLEDFKFKVIEAERDFDMKYKPPQTVVELKFEFLGGKEIHQRGLEHENMTDVQQDIGDVVEIYMYAMMRKYFQITDSFLRAYQVENRSGLYLIKQKKYK